jgi:TonB family protein
MSDVWIQWEGHVVNGTLPLLRCLGASDHSSVFLTEHAAAGLPKAALKLVPAIPSLIEAQLSHWRAAIELPHPRLIRLYESGRCRLGERHFLFLVMEYADQNLAEVLPHRALTAEEAREMLRPTLDTLSFLHGRNLVQGQLKPSNILVVGEQLKLAGDTIRPASEATANIGVPSVYDAPEMEREIFTTAVDIWSLGATLVAALTRQPLSFSDQRRTQLVLPPGFPGAFAEMVQRCLRPEPTARPDVEALRSWIDGPSGTSAVGVADAATASGAPHAEPTPAPRPTSVPRPMPPSLEPRVAAVEEPLPRRPRIPMIVGVIALIIAAWAAFNLFSSRRAVQAPPAAGAAATNDAQTAERERVAAPEPARPEPARPAPAPPVTSAAPRRSAPTSAEDKPTSASSVLHEEIPKVPRSARDTIHGHVRVAVRVTVDKSGSVVGEALDQAGPSQYFARLATQAARKWKFSASAEQAPRFWLVRFEFSRGGTTGHATVVRSR